ncbi:hypothetical protein R5R35_003729 [Gryllus longicercus]|uniref:Uncharacterized protein n=1 Tax=Gryllus longicercus TaxID=2509291 RepID=A0AAN9YXJ1_9ORTH
MTALARIVALAALCAAVLARPGPAAQELSEAEGVDALEVQGLLEEFQAIAEREGERRRRAAPDEQLDAVVEPQNPDSAAVQGLIDEFQAISDRERERRAAPAEPQAEEAAGPVQLLLQEFAESGRARRDAPPPASTRQRRQVDPLLLQGLQEFLELADKEQQK